MLFRSQPGFFGLFALIPLMIWWELKRADAGQATVLVSTVRAFKGTRSWKNFLRPLLLVFRVLTICCLIIALARPQTRNDEQLVNGEGIDIVLCLDISGSMLARQRILNIVDDKRDDQTQCASFILDTEVVPLIGRPTRPFQGWRYLQPEAAPADLDTDRKSVV